MFRKRQRYPCKYPNRNSYFLDTLQCCSSQALFLSVPHTSLLLEVRVQMYIPCFEILCCAEMQNQTEEKFWYSMNWSYLVPCWRVCIINEVSENLSAKERRVAEKILTILPPSLSQGISWGWHFLRLHCLRLFSAWWFQLDGECSETFHFCVSCVPQSNMLVQTLGHIVMQIYLYNF